MLHFRKGIHNPDKATTTRLGKAVVEAKYGNLFEMYEKGQVKPRISARFPMQEAAKALSLIADRKVLGKVVLTND